MSKDISIGTLLYAKVGI